MSPGKTYNGGSKFGAAARIVEVDMSSPGPASYNTNTFATKSGSVSARIGSASRERGKLDVTPGPS